MKRAIPWVIVGALLAGGAAWGVLNRHALATQAREWRAGHLAADALRKLEAGERESAARKASSAVQLAPGHPPALKAAAEVLTAENNPRAAVFWAQLADAQPTPEHLALAARNLAVAGDKKRAAEFLAKLEELPGNELLALQVRAVQSLADKDNTTALAALQELEKRGALPAAEAVALATLRRTTDNVPADKLDADRARLREIAATSLPEALAAMALLASDLNPGDPDARELGERLAAHPRAGVVHKLLAEKIGGGEDASWANRVGEAVAAEAAAWNDTERSAAAIWLLAEGAADAALEALPHESAVGNRNLYILRMRALHVLGQWKTLEDELRQSGLPLSEVERHAALASAVNHLDRPEEVEGHWRRALGAAGSDVKELARLGARAMRSGWTDRAVEIYERLASDPRSAPSAYRALVTIMRDDGLERTLPVLERAVKALPKDDPLLADLVSVRFLLGKGAGADIEAAERLVERNPRVFACRVALALGRLTTGDPTMAMDAFEGVAGADWERIQPSMAAIYAASLGAAGDADGARQVLDRIDLAKLRPEEWNLVRRFLR